MTVFWKSNTSRGGKNITLLSARKLYSIIMKSSDFLCCIKGFFGGGRASSTNALLNLNIFHDSLLSKNDCCLFLYACCQILPFPKPNDLQHLHYHSLQHICSSWAKCFTIFWLSRWTLALKILAPGVPRLPPPTWPLHHQIWHLHKLSQPYKTFIALHRKGGTQRW